MLGILEGQYVRLEVISGKNLKVPSCRIPAGIFVSINVDSKRRWKSAIRVLSSDSAVAWGKTLTISSAVSPRVSLEIRASFELSRTLGQGELIGTLETSWNELLDHGAESFDLSFPPIRGVSPSLTLKATSVHADGNDDDGPFDSILDSEIDQHVDAGNTALAEYLTSKRVTHLDNAVEHFQLVLDQCPVGHPDHAAALTNLAWARLEGYVRKDVQDIKSITALFRDALALYPQDHSDHTLYLYHLTRASIWHHRQECTAISIHASAQLCCELLPLCPEGTYLRSIGVDNGVDYVIHEYIKLPIDTSDEGIGLGQIVLKLCPLGHQRRPSALDRLSRAHCTRFQQSGSIDDMDESIKLYREAVYLCPEGHPLRDTYLSNLALSLQSRFDHQGKSHDFDESISIFEEVLYLRPVGHKFRDESLDNLVQALLRRFHQRSDINNINDIDSSISLRREALASHPPGHPRHDTTLANLAYVLKVKYGEFNATEDVNEVIGLYRELLRLQTHGNPGCRNTLYNLSLALCSRFKKTRKNEDIEEAIDLFQKPLENLPSLHPYRYFSYFVLKNAYLSRYRVQHSPADFSLAIENFGLASRYPTQGFLRRIIEAINWTFAAEMHGHPSPPETYQTFFDLLDKHLVTQSSTIASYEATTGLRASEWSANAPSCAIRHGNLQEAIELLEQGRSQKWSLTSCLRTPRVDLECTNLNMVLKFSELSKHLCDAEGSAVGADRAAVDEAAMQYKRLMIQWEDAVAEIRDLHGFSQFFLPPSYDDLQAAARHGPVIIFIASKYSCGAIIVPTSGKPHYVPFLSLPLAAVEKLKNDFAMETSILRPENPKRLRALLRIVWDGIMLPVVNVLHHDLKLKHRSRIWLCPTAAFTSVPLHAAHPFRMNADLSGLEDLYICSYTPTLSALIRARQPTKTRATPSFVTIGQNRNQRKVPAAVNNEIEIVRKLVPPQVKFTCLSGDEVTQASALEALRHNTWVHLGCNGTQDSEQPYHSHFAMKDKPLTLLDIMEHDAPQAEFAFLSASDTTAGDSIQKTPDEVIHLAAGLQFYGFKSIIGTLFCVDGADVEHVVQAFYEHIFKDLEEGDMPDCTKAALALNRAKHIVRVEKQVLLQERIGFVHIGV